MPVGEVGVEAEADRQPVDTTSLPCNGTTSVGDDERPIVPARWSSTAAPPVASRIVVAGQRDRCAAGRIAIIRRVMLFATRPAIAAAEGWSSPPPERHHARSRRVARDARAEADRAVRGCVARGTRNWLASDRARPRRPARCTPSPNSLEERPVVPPPEVRTGVGRHRAIAAETRAARRKPAS